MILALISGKILSEPLPEAASKSHVHPAAKVSTLSYESTITEYPDEASKQDSLNSSSAFSWGNVTVEYNLQTGTAVFYRNGKRALADFYAGARLPHLITSRDYVYRQVISKDNHFTVVLTDNINPTMKQHFILSDDYFITWIELEGYSLSSNWMAPVIMDGQDLTEIGSSKEIMALWIPFDNDRDVKYEASTINKEDTSYEAAVFFDNTSRNGLVVGSVTHDTWKTGVDFLGSDNRLKSLTVYGGATINNVRNSAMVRDSQPHGQVSGDIISSPKIFVGFFDDWRDGMERYAEANASEQEKLPWQDGVVFGWNSWGAVGEKLNTVKALAASYFIRESLMDHGFSNDGTAYINLDSYWDNPSMDLDFFIDTVHGNGMKAGIYWSPFVDWVKEPGRIVEGSKYRYREIWLKDDNGNPLTYGDGPYALDPTHPGTLERIDYYINYFAGKGFKDYIKLDFLTHGALEGNHYDKSVTTGMQAINYGMRYLRDSIRETMGERVFISQAISPLFPYQYAHSRRISCDKFGFLYESRDMLNCAAYGWWMSGKLYEFNDPDHMSLYSPWWSNGRIITENEAKTRVTSAVITGTVFISGDDFTNMEARIRAKKYLTNPNINNIAKLGKAFRPMEGNTGYSAPDSFVLDNGDGSLYIAVFNWDESKPVSKKINLTRAGLTRGKTYTAVEQWSDTRSHETDFLTVALEPGEAKIFLISDK